jgi:hypothetical protein
MHTRIERGNNLEPTGEPRPEMQCRKPLKLGPHTYTCKRTTGHSGAHDAFCRHTDGVIVRW